MIICNYDDYLGIGISALVLLILCCYIFGLSIGLCCSVSSGAKWLMAAVYLTALLSWAITALVTVLFFTGSTGWCNIILKRNLQ